MLKLYLWSIPIFETSSCYFSLNTFRIPKVKELSLACCIGQSIAPGKEAEWLLETVSISVLHDRPEQLRKTETGVWTLIMGQYGSWF